MLVQDGFLYLIVTRHKLTVRIPLVLLSLENVPRRQIFSLLFIPIFFVIQLYISMRAAFNGTNP
jgi:hypothetical protein